MKRIYIIFFILLITQLASWFYFDGAIKKAYVEYDKKSELVSQLYLLDQKWSKKTQKSELKRIYDFLNAFDVKYTLKEKKGKKTITLQLQKQNSDNVISFILNRNINIKQFVLTKIDNYNLSLSMEII